MSNTIEIGLSALNAAQAGITTAGKNIANAGVVGYSRQKIIQGQEAGNGDGTDVKGIERVFDSFLVSQQTDAQSKNSQLQVQLDNIQMIDNYLSDSTVGLSPAIQNTLSALQDISVSPTDTAARQNLLNNLSYFVNSFNDAQSYLGNIADNVDNKLSSAVAEINTIAQQISKINNSVLVAQSQGNTSNLNLNDLYDKRDQLVSDLSKLTNVKVYNNNNVYDVLIGNSQALVRADKVSEISKPEGENFTFKVNGQPISVSSNDMTGGILQGLLDFKSGPLNKIQSMIGALGYNISSAINDFNENGKDLDGKLGVKVVDIITPSGTIGEASHLKLLDITPNGIAAASKDSNKIDNQNVQSLIKYFQDNPKVIDFASIVSFVGSKTKELIATTASSKTILQNAQTAVQNVSGVNLDEEAASLVKYQQAYQAAAKLIEISKTMFDTLMSLG